MFTTCSHSARDVVGPKDGFRQLPQRTVRPVSNQAFAKLAKRTIMPVMASRCYRQGIFLFKSGIRNLQMSYDNIGFPRGRGLHLGMASELPGCETEVDKQSRQKNGSASTPGDGALRLVKALSCSVDALLWEGRGAVCVWTVISFGFVEAVWY
jgi:hypothetical protein